MDCEEIRIDMQIPDPEDSAENRRTVQVMYRNLYRKAEQYY